MPSPSPSLIRIFDLKKYCFKFVPNIMQIVPNKTKKIKAGYSCKEKYHKVLALKYTAKVGKLMLNYHVQLCFRRRIPCFADEIIMATYSIIFTYSNPIYPGYT